MGLPLGRTSPPQRSCRTKTIFAPATEQGCLALPRKPKGLDPEGVVTRKRSQTSVGNGLEMGDLPQVESQSFLAEREIKE